MQQSRQVAQRREGDDSLSQQALNPAQAVPLPVTGSRIATMGARKAKRRRRRRRGGVAATVAVTAKAVMSEGVRKAKLPGERSNPERSHGRRQGAQRHKAILSKVVRRS